MKSPVLDAPNSDRERFARVALNQLLEPGDAKTDGLVPGMSGVELVRALCEPDEAATEEVRRAQQDVALRLGEIDPLRTLEEADRAGLRFVTPDDDEWPRRLEDLAGAPPVQGRTGVPLGLWVRGPFRLDDVERSVAVVGSRDATSYGTEVAGRIAAGIATPGVVMVSGAAFGIDAAAHRGALAMGRPTIAVLACGADVAYPATHRPLLDRIADDGAVVSELPPGQRVTRLRFLGRNRLIAGLTRGTVVVEAAPRSGALNTANWASRLNRQLMCVPGPVTSLRSAGVHELVRDGRGVLVTRSEDVMELISRPGEYLVADRPKPRKLRDALTVQQQQILDAVPVGVSATVTTIAREAGLALTEVGTTLVTLRCRGLVEQDAAGWRISADAASE